MLLQLRSLDILRCYVGIVRVRTKAKEFSFSLCREVIQNGEV